MSDPSSSLGNRLIEIFDLRQISAKFSYELGPKGVWAMTGFAVLLVIVAFSLEPFLVPEGRWIAYKIFPNSVMHFCRPFLGQLAKQSPSLAIGAVSSLLIYILSLVITARTNVEGPDYPLKHPDHAKRIADAKREVLVYVTFLNSLLCKSDGNEERARLLNTERDCFLNALRKHIGKSVPEITFLLLDPISSNAASARDERAKQIGRTKEFIQEAIQQNLWTLYCLSRYEGVKIKVCKYTNFPSISIIHTESLYSISPYESIPLSDTSRFKVHEDGALGKVIKNLVEDIKKSSSECESNQQGWFHELWLTFSTAKEELSFPYIEYGKKEVYVVWVDDEYANKYYAKLAVLEAEVKVEVSDATKKWPSWKSLKQVKWGDKNTDEEHYNKLCDEFKNQYGLVSCKSVNVLRFLRVGYI